MRMLTYIDFILFPLYVVVLVFFIRWFNKKYNKGSGISGLFQTGFRVKLFFGILFAFFSAFILPGDTEMYYTGGVDFKKIVFESTDNLRFLTAPAAEFGDYYEAKGYRPENYGYISAASNLAAMKFVAFFSIFTFNSYLAISMCFAVFSFFGLWFMFKVFYRIYPTFFKPIFLAFFFIPSVLFWGSGVLKDTLCLGFLGIGFYNAYLFCFEKRYQLKIFIAFVVSFYFLYVFKPYIAMAFIPSFFLWYMFRLVGMQKNKLVKSMYIVVPSIALIIFLASGELNNIIAENAVETIAENMKETQQNYIRTTPDDGALIDYGEIVPTPLGIARIMPQALVATLFRPFLWEAKKATALIAALEGAFLFCFTLYVFLKRGPFSSIRAILSDSTIAFSFIFSIVFATAIGLNCFNLGTLVRYKIPCLPFYLISLILILKKQAPKENIAAKATTAA
jgi:hypothetical protein